MFKRFTPFVFLTILLIQILLLSKVLVPKINYPSDKWNVGYSMEEYEKVPENLLEVCFIGTSHFRDAASPMSIYKESGITSYNLSTQLQYMRTSHYLVKHIFRKQSPKVIVVDASSLFNEPNEVTNFADRYIFYVGNFDIDKIDLIADQLSDEGLDFLSNNNSSKLISRLSVAAIFPFYKFYKYHSRWSEIDSSDYSYSTEKYFEEGGTTNTAYSSGVPELSEINEVADIMYNDTIVTIKRYENGDYSETETEERLYDPKISQKNIDYLKKIKDLCEEHGCELLLTKVPSVKNPNIYNGAWTEYKHNITKKLAEDLNISFYDMLYDDDIGIDWNSSSYDQGGHMNYNGQQKVSEAIVDYLISNYGIKENRNGYYDEKLKLYEKVLPMLRIQSTVSLDEYIDNIEPELTHCAVLIEAVDDMRTSLTELDISFLRELGLQSDFSGMNNKDSFLAYIDRGNVVYEAISNRELAYTANLSDGNRANITSKGFYVGAAGNVVINGKGPYNGGRGLNFIIYDYNSCQVIDQVRFDTSVENHMAIHINSFGIYKSFEDKIINE